jgi:16S rRNA (cytosine967-C5)-methyltransferase
MTPGARLQAAIELVEAVFSQDRAADRIVAAHWRARRYAGSKDRRAVNEQVFSVIRKKARLAWRLRQSGLDDAAAASARLLVLADAVMAQAGAARFDVDALREIVPHGPTPVTAEECDFLVRAAALGDQAPDWVEAELPEWLVPAFRAEFGEALPVEMRAMNGRAPLDIRVNLLKADCDQVLRKFAEAGIKAAPSALSPMGIRIEVPVDLRRLEIFRQGWIEPQDTGSQLAALLVDAKPGQTVIDFCAGAGGKTLALAAARGNQANGDNRGKLIAFDTNPRRLKELQLRARRAGASVIELGGGEVPAIAADRVLVDAPCSGTGTWRRAPEARWRLTPDRLAGHVASQDSLLQAASRCVAKGGRLIYATCSVLACENQERVEKFVRQNADFTILPVGALWREAVGGEAPCPDPYLRLTPHGQQTDGFFVAVLARKD